MKAFCKFSGCCSFTFTKDKEPIIGKDVCISIHITGAINHGCEAVQSRNVLGDLREDTAKQLKTKCPTEVLHSSLAKLPDPAYEAADLTGSPTLATIKKVSAEKRDNRDRDEMKRECFITANTMKSTDTSGQLVRGYIQHLDFLGFTMHMYSNLNCASASFLLKVTHFPCILMLLDQSCVKCQGIKVPFIMLS